MEWALNDLEAISATIHDRRIWREVSNMRLTSVALQAVVGAVFTHLITVEHRLSREEVGSGIMPELERLIQTNYPVENYSEDELQRNALQGGVPFIAPRDMVYVIAISAVRQPLPAALSDLSFRSVLSAWGLVQSLAVVLKNAVRRNREAVERRIEADQEKVDKKFALK